MEYSVPSFILGLCTAASRLSYLAVPDTRCFVRSRLPTPCPSSVEFLLAASKHRSIDASSVIAPAAKGAEGARTGEAHLRCRAGRSPGLRHRDIRPCLPTTLRDASLAWLHVGISPVALHVPPGGRLGSGSLLSSSLLHRRLWKVLGDASDQSTVHKMYEHSKVLGLAPAQVRTGAALVEPGSRVLRGTV